MTPRMITTAADREIERLMALHPKGFDLSLDRITRLLERLGNPQDRLPPVIHIAGTNGKGSAAAFSRALLEAAGYRVHVHTSPHLVNWHERYRLARRGGGKFVDDEVLADAIARVADANRGETITVFEILTAVTFLLFSEHPADAAIIEVGLGGRFDATNVIDKPGRVADHADLARPRGLSRRPGRTDRRRKGRHHQAGLPGRRRRAGDRDGAGGAGRDRRAARLRRSPSTARISSPMRKTAAWSTRTRTG